MAGPSPNIPSLFEAREFHFRFQWRGGSCAGGALLFLNNDRILSPIDQTKHQTQILKYLETTKFKDFETNHSKIQRHLLKFDGGNQGYLSVRFIPQRIRLTAEPEVVVWNDDSLDGSATNVDNPHLTLDDLSSENLSTSMSFAASSGEVGRPQSVLTEQSATCSSPPASTPTNHTNYGKTWSPQELNRLRNHIVSGDSVNLNDFPGRTKGALKSQARMLRDKGNKKRLRFKG